jgi:hypothetical protein
MPFSIYSTLLLKSKKKKSSSTIKIKMFGNLFQPRLSKDFLKKIY